MQAVSNKEDDQPSIVPPEDSAAPRTPNPIKAEISYFSSPHETIPSETTSILEFALRVKLGTYGEAIRKIRQYLEDGDPDEAKRLKKFLPVVSFSGVVVEGGRASAFPEERFKHSGYLQGDFDGENFHTRSPEEVKALLAGDEHVQVVFLSPRNGVKAIIRIPVCKSPAEHLAAFLAAEAYFRDNYHLKIDASTKDAVRLCYVSHDPDAYIDYSPATELPVTAPGVAGRDSMNGAAGGQRGGNAAPRHEKLTTEEIRRMLACIPTRPDYDPWLRISSAVWAATGDEATGTALLKEWSPEEKPGEYSEKFNSRLTKITAGTLVHFAREHGYEFPSGVKNDGSLQIPDDVFPLPAGDIEYRKSGEIIFRAIAPTHTVFMRGGSAHEVVDDGSKPAHFAPLSPERFCSLVENYDHRVARREWQARKEGEDEGQYIWRSKRMPVNAAKVLLLSDPARRNLPPIRQLAACPILTKGGAVLERGYHDHAGGTYVTGGEIPQEMPVAAATAAILGLLDDFNFTTPADKSRAVASFLSPALKMGDWINDDFPLDVAEATTSQSGKTYRQKLVVRVYNEIPSAIVAPRGGVGSLDESISAALIKGRPFITLDNFRGILDSTILEQSLRGAGRVSCRALRISADVDTRPFNWQLSTNGAEFTRDIANRSIITRIRKQDAGYSFKEYAEGGLEAHVAANQPFYLGAVFSIIKEWTRNGCPKTDEKRHDFRGWCRSLDWIVQHIFGLAPLLDGHREEQARTANPALQWLREVTMAAQRTGQLGRELTTTQLVSIAEDDGIEFPGNSLSKEQPHQRAGKILGRLFRESDGQPINVDGLVVAREEHEKYVPGRGSEKQKLYTIKEQQHEGTVSDWPGLVPE